MKISTAKKLVCMSYFTVDGLRPLLATATRIVCSGDTKRFLFPDGSVIESNKGNWKVVGMEKNPKLEAAMRRFGNGQVLPDRPWPRDEVAGEAKGVVRGSGQLLFKGTKEQREEWMLSGSYSTFQAWLEQQEIVKPYRYMFDAKLPTDERCHLLASIAALQKLLDEKDEQLDKASRPMVVRLDWWAVALVGLVLVAHYGFGVL